MNILRCGLKISARTQSFRGKPNKNNRRFLLRSMSSQKWNTRSNIRYRQQICSETIQDISIAIFHSGTEVPVSVESFLNLTWFFK